MNVEKKKERKWGKKPTNQNKHKTHKNPITIIQFVAVNGKLVAVTLPHHLIGEDHL